MTEIGETITIYECSEGHVSSVTRVPNDLGVRRCFFCPKSVAAPIRVTRIEEEDATDDKNG